MEKLPEQFENKSTIIVKEPKQRKPRTTKKKVEIKQENIVQEEQKTNEDPHSSGDKKSVIVSIDPGFIKMGLAVLDSQDAKIIETQCVQIRPQGEKLTQGQVEAVVNVNLKKLFDSLYDKYTIDFVVIELQLGNFSCTPVQTAVVAQLQNNTKFVIQHSKLKLKHPEAKEVENTNKESKQYNQNKQLGRLLAQHIYKEFKEDNYDQCDAVLHGLFAFRNKNSISFISKEQFI